MISDETDIILPHHCPDCFCGLGSEVDTCPGCGTSRPHGGWTLDPYVGTSLIERYQLTSLLACGGSGRVYLARDQKHGTDLGRVVVKLLHQPTRSSDRGRFLREAQATRLIQSPHAVKVYDFGFHDGHPFLVMEWLRGETLRALVRRGRMDEALAIQCVIQAAQVLSEAHSNGIVHRDIKPDNLMVMGNDARSLKVLDFGIARLSGAETTHSSPGTPLYMAPEQLSGHRIDGRSDIYSLGATLFEMLTGRPPYPAGSQQEAFGAHLHAPIPSPRAIVGTISSNTDAVVMAMLAKDPVDRPETMDDVIAALSGTRVVKRKAKPRVPKHFLVGLVVVFVASGSASVLLVRMSEGPLKTAGSSEPTADSSTETPLSPLPHLPSADAASSVIIAPKLHHENAHVPKPASSPRPTKPESSSSLKRSGQLREEHF